MKTSLSFLMILFLSIYIQNHGFGQWIDISPQGSYNYVTLFDTYFIDDNTGFAVGQDLQSGYGYIFKTVDGGSTWSDTSFADAHLRSIDFKSNAVGFVVGYDNPPATMTKIFTTIDAGNSWIMSTDNTFTGMDGIQFVTSDIAYMYGYGSVWGYNAGIMKTTNGGSSWNYISDNGGLLICDMHFIDANTGFFAVLNMTSLEGTIQKTSNGGTGFNTIYTGEWIMSNYFVNSNTGYLLEGLNATDRKLIKTNDGGTSWNSTYLGEDYKSVYFINEYTGYIYGGGGLIKKTNDGGISWQSETSVMSLSFEKSACHTNNYIFISGNGGTIVKSLHGATTGIDKHSNRNNSVNVFPNPFSDLINIDIMLDEKITLEIYDQAGKLQFSQMYDENIIRVDGEQFGSGVYFYKILVNAKSYSSGKIIKL